MRDPGNESDRVVPSDSAFRGGAAPQVQLCDRAGLRKVVGARPLLLVTTPTAQDVRAVLDGDAAGIVLRHDGPTLLAAAVRAVGAGRIWLSPSLSELLVELLREQHPPCPPRPARR